MTGSFARRLVTLGMLLMVALAWPGSAAAIVNGGCTAEGHSSGGSSVDITTDDVWHLNSGETAGGSGTAPGPMGNATVGAYALGLLIPIARSPGDGNPSTSGTVDNVALSNFSKLGKVFVVGGNASGDGGSCDGQILIILDDVDALFTILGGGGLAAAIVGLAIMLASGRGQGCLTKITGTFGGGLAGVGLALAGEQFELFQPTSYIGMAIAIIGALLGFLVAGRLAAARPGAAPPPAAAPRVPAPMPAPQAPVLQTPAAPAPVPEQVPPQPGADDAQHMQNVIERAETGDPATQGFLEQVAGPGVLGETPKPPAAPPPPPTPPTEPPMYKGSLLPRSTITPTQEAMMENVDLGGELAGLTPPDPDAPAPSEPSEPSPKPPTPPTPPTEDQELIEGVVPPDGNDRPVGGGSPN